MANLHHRDSYKLHDMATPSVELPEVSLMPQRSNSASDDKSSDDFKDGNVHQHVAVDDIPVNVIEEDLKKGMAHDMVSDPNIDPALRARVEAALEAGDVAAEKALEEELLNDSIYPEVRAAVANIDDPDMPVNTFRTWFLGIIAVIVLCGVNQLLYFRYPSVTITGLAVQVFAFPLGKGLEKILPTKVFKTRWGKFTLNPGPFNVKEHTMISIMATVVYQRAYCTDIFINQKLMYNNYYGFGYQILITLSTQLIGFSFAGFCRRFVIWPAAMIWPGTLAYSALLSTLHHQKATEPGRMSREKFFGISFVIVFFWYFFPGYIFTALSSFSWVAWIAPNNIVVNQLFGVVQGLGMGLVTFDWAQINYIGSSPLVTPFFAQANTIFGLVVFFWICCPILMYTNSRYSKYLPMSSSRSYDRFGKKYNTTAVITPLATLDTTAYESYSHLYLSPVFMMSYGLSFASMTATITHTALYNGKTIMKQFRTSLTDEPDIHARLMSVYREVPQLWYAGTFLFALVCGIIGIEVWPTQLPVWALFLSLLIGAVYTIPIAMIYAMTNVEVGLNVITEFIIGYALPGKPLAMMLFKTWGYMSMYQGVSFMQDQKFAHYMKVPPRSTFMAQLIASVIACFVLLAVQIWALGNIDGICTDDAVDNFICPSTTVIGTASVIWGLIGPAKNFSAGAEYNAMLWFFLLGAVLPVPTYFLAKRYPKSLWRYVNWPVVFTGTGYIPPATGINYSSWALVGFLSHVLWRRRNFGSWTRYNYVLSAALDAGTGISQIFIFFCLIFPSAPLLQNWYSGTWWGNTVYTGTADALGTRVLEVPANGFAPAPNGQF